MQLFSPIITCLLSLNIVLSTLFLNTLNQCGFTGIGDKLVRSQKIDM
jgi:hypothetical protein